MTFLLSKLFWIVMRPSTLLLLIGLLGLVLAWSQRVRAHRSGRRAGAAGLVLVTLSLGGYGLVMALSLNQFLLRPLEERFPQVGSPPAQVAGIIVLGGSIDRGTSSDHNLPSLNDTAERITTFAALARRYPAAKLVFTGGQGSLDTTAPPEAAMARTLLDSLGLADRGVVYEDRSRNTLENAQFTRALVHPAPGEVWILVTSASHMPRSVGIFRKDGWTVLPWPVGYKTGRSLGTIYGDALPDKLEQIDWATHEWVGLLAYWLLDRTDSLFPAPERAAG